MNKPHKHAEVIKAWADGAQVERRFPGGSWGELSYPHFGSSVLEYRVYDPLREYKEAYARGEKIEVYLPSIAAWVPFERYQENSGLSIEKKWEFIGEYPLSVRIAPKPDYTLECDTIICGGEVDLRVTFDGTTGKPKAVELVK